MTLGALAFLNPWLLAGLLTLPAIYWLLRAVPPRPAQIEFPPTRILVGLEADEKTADKTPWWLTLLRLLAAGLVIMALADPVLKPSRDAALKGEGPLVIVADNGWASAARWPERAAMISRLISEAERASRGVVIAETAAQSKGQAFKVMSPAEAANAAAAITPQPFAPDRIATADAVQQALTAANVAKASVVWLHDGVDHGGKGAEFGDRLKTLADGNPVAVIDETAGQHALALAARIGDKGSLEAIVLSPSGAARSGTIIASSARGARLGDAQFNIKVGETQTIAPFSLPLELRNQVARIEILSERSAGAVHLVDAATQWHRIGLISGESREKAQPLLAPLYYIQKALAPFAELAIAKDANLGAGLENVLKQNVSVLMLADIGTLTGEAAKQVEGFVERGGVLVRFAGSRLEKAGDELLPVPLRAGGRSLGGALSWSQPQALAAFDEASPFAGLTIPPDVAINRQVLADPAKMLPEVEVWARLQDGTPLVTSTQRGDGKLVLFHITANADWSNLPISGLFVDMLRRISTMGRIGASQTVGDASADGATADATANAAAAPDASVLPPLRTLDGAGVLKSPPPLAEPLKLNAFAKTVPSLVHPPGYYGASASPRALNVVTEKTTLSALTTFPSGTERLSYQDATSTALKPWMLALALGLLLADIVAVLALQAGGLKQIFTSRTAAARAASLMLLTLAGLALGDIRANAQGADQTPGGFSIEDQIERRLLRERNSDRNPDRNLDRYDSLDRFDAKPSTRAEPMSPRPLNPAEKSSVDATSKVTFGYVLSGDQTTDDASRMGLTGLGRALETRTAVEPGPPAAVDITKDEIAFFPILYWPVLQNAETLPDAAIAKIDAYMKEGGLIIFDTRDYGQGGANLLPMAGKTGNALQRLLGKLDVPRLEPVPETHVVTKSFYLLRSFPGRWDGGQLWVEAVSESDAQSNRARVSDGVTSIMVTSNDFAAAWAVDERGRPMYPVVPGGEMQREMAWRSGVNIVMHALTGNYKADQVHVPALLERLGQ